MSYRQAIRWLLGLQQYGVKLGLRNMRVLLARLGHPEQRYPSLLVTGSNGKGSVTAMLSAALRARGLRVGSYTSPHLVDFEERIVVDGQAMARRALGPQVSLLAAAIRELLRSGRLAHHPTYFEVATALAFLEFARREVDVAVLEVGLGGRFDATNVADPVVSAITAIALEHTVWLGDTLPEIAFEKAGIARSGRPLVVGALPPPAHAVVRERARAVGASLVVAPRSLSVRLVKATRRGIVLTARSARGDYPPLRVPLPGRHQAANVAVAVAALEALPEALRPEPDQVARGLVRTRWPGRLEYVPGRPRLLLDGAHNPHAARALVRYLEEFEPRGRKVLVFACLRDKDLRGIMGPLFPLFGAVILARLHNRRAIPAGELRRLAPPAPPLTCSPGPAAALAAARRLAGARGLVVVTGSLYLVGAVKGLVRERSAAGSGPSAAPP